MPFEVDFDLAVSAIAHAARVDAWDALADACAVAGLEVSGVRMLADLWDYSPGTIDWLRKVLHNNATQPEIAALLQLFAKRDHDAESVVEIPKTPASLYKRRWF